MTYAELQVTTNYDFLRGASHPRELVVAAKTLGLGAIGITDRNTVAGVVRAWSKGREIAQKVLTGARLDFADETPSVLCYPTDREAWGRLTRLLSLGQRRVEKGDCRLLLADLLEHGESQLVLIVPPEDPAEDFQAALRRIAGAFRGRAWLVASRPYGPADLKRLVRLDAIARAAGAPMIAANDVLYHEPQRRPLQDVLTCIREGRTIAEAGLILEANAERHLKSPAEMARLFAHWPGAVERTAEVAARIGFDLGQLRYEYPDEPVPPGKTAMGHLTDLAWRGAAWRYPDGLPEKVRTLLAHELSLIEEMDYPNYFLTVHDIVHWARDEGILCQGRGSAANSVVCFCLGITAVDPTKPDHDLLFARFISKERGEPPDIDVDFEHEQREEVMQYVYRRYGRERAAICATVIHYRPRSAIRDIGKALGLTEDVTAALANTVWGSWGEDIPDEHIRQVGLDPESPDIRRATVLAGELVGFPRHLSQHVGGFVLTKRRLDETVPIGNAAMAKRTFIEWDKDDIDALGLMKVDVLALGMLSAIRKAMDTLGIADMADIPPEDPAVYDMLCRGDSVGVFQVESRAQMSMLPRLKPRKFYDLVIEVAIVRPGPIQGDMVHPYLRRRDKIEAVDYPKPAPEHGPADELRQVLGKTLGVPLFQEQAMRLAIEAAKFTSGEADGLRRAMGTFRDDGDLGAYSVQFIQGMVRRGYDPAFAERCFRQIKGFGSYGFPESHAVSFALLVYVSAWIKHYHPDVFCVAMLNSQPMGFYQPAQLVRDARDHGVEVRAPDVMLSGWDSALEEENSGGHNAQRPCAPSVSAQARAPIHLPRCAGEVARDALPHRVTKGAQGRTLRPVRLGLRQIRGFREEAAHRIVKARQGWAGGKGPRALKDLAVRAGLDRRALELLAEADAFRSLGLDRRAALWAVKGLAPEAGAEAAAPLLALMGPPAEAPARLPLMALPAHVDEDYRTTGLSLKAHPCVFFRPLLRRLGAIPAGDLPRLKDGARVSVGGLVLVRQRPGTAKGVVFLTLEDESGPANAVVWRDVFMANRRAVMGAAFLVVHGRLQRAGEVIHVVAERFTDLTGELRRMKTLEEAAAGEAPDAPLPIPEARRLGSGRAGLVRSRDFH